MSKRWSAVWACALAVTSGCVGFDDETSSTTAELESAAIGVRDSGSWYEYECGQVCWRKQSFWIDLDVKNDTYDKRVAVVWTDDGWETQQVAYAQYERSLGGGREQWGVDVMLGYFSGPFDQMEVEYAALVEKGGATYWDPANNHHVFGRVTRQRPVKLLTSKVSYQTGVGAVLTGTVRVYNIAYEKKVSVVYSTDDWATSAEVDATWSQGNDWSFRVEGLGIDDLPDTVRFAIRYRVAGEEHWDNNDAYDYAHRLEPQLYVGTPGGSPEDPFAGIFSIYASQYGDLPLERLDVRIDDQPWSVGDVGLGWRQLERSTFGLADGEHQIEVRARLQGGYATSAIGGVFYVENRVTPLGAWDPDFGEMEGGAPGVHGYSSGVAIDPAGHVFLQWSEPWSWDSQSFFGVTRFASFGTDLAPVAFERLPAESGSYGATVERLAADSLGRVYGVRRWPWSVWRWTAAGAIDTTFADGGKLDFGEDVGGLYLDTIGDVTTGGDYLWITGARPSFAGGGRVVARFDDTGALAGVVELPAPPEICWYCIQPVATWAGGALWVQTDGKLLQIGDDAGGGLAVLDEITLDAAVRAPLQDLVRTAAGHFVGLDSGGRLVAIGADGTRRASWLLYSNQLLLGGVRSPIQLAILSDGNVAVLDGDSGRLVVFDDTIAAP